MAIKKRLLVCECGEQFEEGKNDDPLVGNARYGVWKFKQHTIRESAQTRHDIVTVNYVRSVMCGACENELFKERKNYEIRPQSSAKPSAKAYENRFDEDDDAGPKSAPAMRLVGTEAS